MVKHISHPYSDWESHTKRQHPRLAEGQKKIHIQIGKSPELMTPKMAQSGRHTAMVEISEPIFYNSSQYISLQLFVMIACISYVLLETMVLDFHDEMFDVFCVLCCLQRIHNITMILCQFHTTYHVK